MKVGILTFQDTKNFGACLQALALYKKVCELGHEVEIIDYINARIHHVEYEYLRPRFNLKAIIIWLLWGRREQDKYRCLKAQMKELCKFSGSSYSNVDINAANSIYDRFLVGSDQVWALNVTDYDYNYMLDFVDDDEKKYSFSSSISNESLFAADNKAVSLVGKFKRISVREQEAVDVILQTLNRKVELVCDPTMLLTAGEWDLLLNPRHYDEDYVFIYFSDPESKIFKDAKEYAAKNNLKVYYCNSGRKVAGVKSVFPKSLAEFVGLIKYSKAVFTASYHGMLFGVYYQKQMLFYNRNQKSRMYSLSRMLDITANQGEISADGTIPFIDYEKVNPKVNEFRSYSLNVLKDILNDESGE